jgi:hypothetical protein
MLDTTYDDTLCVCITPGCCHLHLYRYTEDAGTEYWWAVSSCHGMRLWDRINLAWQVLWGRDIDWNGQMFGGHDARAIRDWLDWQIKQES